MLCHSKNVSDQEKCRAPLVLLPDGSLLTEESKVNAVFSTELVANVGSDANSSFD